MFQPRKIVKFHPYKEELQKFYGLRDGPEGFPSQTRIIRIYNIRLTERIKHILLFSLRQYRIQVTPQSYGIQVFW